MKQISRGISICVLCMLCTFMLQRASFAEKSKDDKWKRAKVYMPVSLAMGSVRTPEFAAVNGVYFIIVQAQKPLPFLDMQCMMSLATGSGQTEGCTKDRLLQADWTVWDQGHIVAQGTSESEGGYKYTNSNLYKSLGAFPARAGEKYVVEVKFTKDGTPLNVANPHLIVILHDDFW